MAATKTQRVHNYSSSRIGVVDLTGDNSYPTGGYPVTAADFGLTDIIHVAIQQGRVGLIFEYDYVNQKVIFRYPTGGATASPAALAVPAVTTGASTASAVNATTPALTPGQAKELLATTDVTTVSIRLVAWGS